MQDYNTREKFQATRSVKKERENRKFVLIAGFRFHTSRFYRDEHLNIVHKATKMNFHERQSNSAAWQFSNISIKFSNIKLNID